MALSVTNLMGGGGKPNALYCWSKYSISQAETVTNPVFSCKCVHADKKIYISSESASISGYSANFDVARIDDWREFFGGFRYNGFTPQFVYNGASTLQINPFSYTYVTLTDFVVESGSDYIAYFTYETTSSDISFSNREFAYSGTKFVRTGGDKTFIEYIIDNNANAYPNDGVHTDGYYYVKVGRNYVPQYIIDNVYDIDPTYAYEPLFITELSENRFFMMYANSTSRATYYASVLEYDENTDKFTLGTSLQVATTQSWTYRDDCLLKVDDNKVVVHPHNNLTSVYVFTIDGSEVTMSTFQFMNVGSYPRFIHIENKKYLVLEGDYSKGLWFEIVDFSTLTIIKTYTRVKSTTGGNLNVSLGKCIKLDDTHIYFVGYINASYIAYHYIAEFSETLVKACLALNSAASYNLYDTTGTYVKRCNSDNNIIQTITKGTAQTSTSGDLNYNYYGSYYHRLYFSDNYSQMTLLNHSLIGGKDESIRSLTIVDDGTVYDCWWDMGRIGTVSDGGYYPTLMYIDDNGSINEVARYSIDVNYPTMKTINNHFVCASMGLLLFSANSSHYLIATKYKKAEEE